MILFFPHGVACTVNAESRDSVMRTLGLAKTFWKDSGLATDFNLFEIDQRVIVLMHKVLDLWHVCQGHTKRQRLGDMRFEFRVADLIVDRK